MHARSIARTFCLARASRRPPLPPLRMAHAPAQPSIRFLSAKEALDVDVELMGDVIQYPTEVLMELAGLRYSFLQQRRENWFRQNESISHTRSAAAHKR